MHLVYSANSIAATSDYTLPVNTDEQHCKETLLRFRAFQTVCDKYSGEIASIQKYIPGWLPVFK